MKKTTNFYLRTAATLSAAVVMLFGAALFSGCENDEEKQEVVPALVVAPATIPAIATGGEYTETVTANVAWTATVTAGDDFITLTNGSGPGDGAFTVNIAPNTGFTARTGTVTVTGGGLTQTVSVTQTANEPVLTVEPLTIGGELAGGDYPVTVTANLEWAATVTAGDDFISLTGGSGTSSGSFTVRLTANDGVAPRSGTVTVTGGTITHTIGVTQIGLAPALEVAPGALTDVAAEGTATDITVTANVAWTATVTAGNFISISDETGQDGNGSFKINVAANAGAARSGTVTVTGDGVAAKTIAITQEAAPAPTLTIRYPNADDNYTAIQDADFLSNWTIGVTSNTTVTAVITGNPDWIEVFNIEGLPGEGFVHYQATSANTSNCARIAKIVISNSGSEATVTFIQRGTGGSTLTPEQGCVPTTPTLLLSTETYNPAAESGATTITVTANVTWDATVTAGDDFISISDKTGNTGTSGGSFTINVTANTGAARSGTVTVTDGNITKYVAVEQQAKAAAPAPVLTLLEPNGGKFTEDYTKIGGLYAKFEHTNLSDVSDLVVTWQDTYDWIALGPGSQGKNPYPDGTNPSIAWALFMVGSQNSSHCAREAKVDIYAEGSNTLTVTFLQKGASGSEQTPANGCDINASLAVSPTELTGVTDAGDNTTITVTANVTWDATVTTGAFITISDETGNTGTSGGSFKITVAKNETSYPRNGVVTVTGTGGIVRTIAVTQVASSATPAVPGESVLHGGVYWATHNVKVKGVSFTDNAGDLGYNFVDAERWDAPEVVATYCPAGWHVPSRAEYQAAKAGGVELDNSDFNSATQVTLNDGAGSTALILPFWTTGPEGYNRGGVYIGDKQDDFMGLGFFGWTQNGELYNISNNGSQAWQRYLRCIRN